jgi:hypothetical protein
MKGYSPPSRKALRTSLFTVVVVLAAVFIIRLLMFPTGGNIQTEDVTFDRAMVGIAKGYFSCTPYDGWEHRLRVWVSEARDALRMKLPFSPYDVKALAHRLGGGRVAYDLARIIVLREALIEWYSDKVSPWDIKRFKEAHVGYYRVHTSEGCVDYSGAPLNAVSYDVDLDASWVDANRLGLTLELYIDWLYMYSDG